jgi:hypothetical protein
LVFCGFVGFLELHGQSLGKVLKWDRPEYSVNPIAGNSDPKHVSTSFVERQNLTMRMGMRRFTRLTNGFSKKVENLACAVSLHFMHYNFCRIHQTLRVTPAMEAGVTDHIWTIEDVLRLIDTTKLSFGK